VHALAACLSCLRRKSHGQFLGGTGGATRRSYPTIMTWS
jgi:hypothetical protein